MSQPPRVQRHYRLSIRDLSPEGRPLVTIEMLAVESGLHPELVQRLIALGALEPVGGTSSQPRYPRDAAAILARIVRLRGDLGLNYAGALLANELLSRIQLLERQLRLQPPDTDAPDTEAEAGEITDSDADAHQGAAQQDAAQQDSAQQDSAQQDSAQQESAKQGSAQPDPER
ncbi:chaperone modulator CbpM [Nakamurella aerolata]|uniref:MerR family transcriptional regulator n=1 Tax=Nakamurella aerolata TaxID=1656892 RepID=A0A849A5H2_9ACTN|nr:chaperone modulator CbpM [Nakamurella aerolata]NNG36234.1 hypothetical protein [Nakamurella aerolata]